MAYFGAGGTAYHISTTGVVCCCACLVDLKDGDGATECQCIVASPECAPSVSLGQYNISWKRSEEPFILNVKFAMCKTSMLAQCRPICNI